ncbi:MAG: SurA N-terminal domain-containing protein [Pseudomonadota bacterium]
MRTAVSSLWVKILLGALVLSFISFYGFRGSRGLSAGVMASVNGESISSRDLQIRYQNLLERYRQMGLLRNDTSDDLLRMIQQNALQTLIDEKIKTRQARQIGLRVSPEQVRKVIRMQFAGAKEEFNFDFYRNYIRSRFGKTTGEFEKDEAATQLAWEYDGLLRQTTLVSTEELRRLFEMRNDQVSLDFVRLDPTKLASRLPAPATPTEADLKRYYDERAAAYQIPEARELEVVGYNLTDLVTPTDSDLKDLLGKKFAKEKDVAVTGERAHAAHILIRTGIDVAVAQKRVDAIYARIKGEAEFSKVARAESEDGSRSEGGETSAGSVKGPWSKSSTRKHSG